MLAFVDGVLWDTDTNLQATILDQCPQDPLVHSIGGGFCREVFEFFAPEWRKLQFNGDDGAIHVHSYMPLIQFVDMWEGGHIEDKWKQKISTASTVSFTAVQAGYEPERHITSMWHNFRDSDRGGKLRFMKGLHGLLVAWTVEDGGKTWYLGVVEGGPAQRRWNAEHTPNEDSSYVKIYSKGSNTNWGATSLKKSEEKHLLDRDVGDHMTNVYWKNP